MGNLRNRKSFFSVKKINELLTRVLEAKEKIIESATELFIRYGIRSVTMDDVAKETSMSKKTLYQYFQNKDSLVTEVVKRHFELERSEFKQIKSKAENAIHELILTAKCIRKHVYKMNPSLLLDMQKFYGAAWDEYLDFKNSTIKGQIEEIICQGIEEGCFRPEINPQILAIFRVESIQLIFDPKLFPGESFDFPTVHIQLMDHFINGLLTNEGRKRYEEYNQLENQTTQTNL